MHCNKHCGCSRRWRNHDLTVDERNKLGVAFPMAESVLPLAATLGLHPGCLAALPTVPQNCLYLLPTRGRLPTLIILQDPPGEFSCDEVVLNKWQNLSNR